MNIESVESYWASELGEEIEIVECGGYGLYIGGQACYAGKTLSEIERYLESYFMVKGV